ncbi:MAG: hypothetical protein KBA46_08150 [Candidatus Omnitrophica bacterium]|nr:hypothetical protein [Candidatus Omnitrophota bacterium]
MRTRIVAIACAISVMHVIVSGAHAQITTERQFTDFVSYYYRNPQPAQAPAALQFFLTSHLFNNSVRLHTRLTEVTAFFFGRVAMLHPEVLREYERLYLDASKQGKLFLADIFAIASDSDNQIFMQKEAVHQEYAVVRDKVKAILAQQPLGRQKLDQGISDYRDIDFLWTEFFVTGDPGLILYLIALLEKEDVVRTKLTQWMARSSHTHDEFAKLQAACKRALNINLKDANLGVGAAQDLDCLLGGYLRFAKSMHKQSGDSLVIKDMLGLTDADIKHAVLKQTALWSLASYAKLHEQVFALCKKAYDECLAENKFELALISRVRQ